MVNLVMMEEMEGCQSSNFHVKLKTSEQINELMSEHNQIKGGKATY